MHYLPHRCLGHDADGPIHWAVPSIEGAAPVTLRRIGWADPAARSTLRHVAERIALDDHPGLAVVHDVDADKDGAYLAMELLDPYDPPPTADGVLDDTAALVAALGALHDVGVAHGGLSIGSLHRRNRDLVVADAGMAAARAGLAPWATVAAQRDDTHAILAVLGDLAAGLPDGDPWAPVLRALANSRCRSLEALTTALDRVRRSDPGDGRRAVAAPADGAGVRIDACRALEATRQTSSVVSRPAPATPSAHVGGAYRRRTHRWHRARPHNHRARPRTPAIDWRASVGATVAMVALAMIAVSITGPGDPADPAAVGGRVASGQGSTDCATPLPDPGRVVVDGQVDLDGDGCPDPLTWSVEEAVLYVGNDDATRYAFGEPGDVAVLGDWDGDGVATPGIYRPSTGSTHLFDRWATDDHEVRAAPGPRLAPESTPVVTRGDDGDVIIAVADAVD